MHKMTSLVRFIGTVFCAAALTLIPAAALAQECGPVPDGLVGWWSGNGNTDDSQGGNNGTLVGAATFAAGHVEQAYSFPQVACGGPGTCCPDGDSVDLGTNSAFKQSSAIT